MSTVRTAIQMYDGMTPALRAMNNAMHTVINSFESIQAASSTAVDTASIRVAREELKRAEIAFDGVEQQIRQAEQQQNKLNNSIRTGTTFATMLKHKFIGIAASVGLAFGGKQVLSLSDELSQTNARLNLMKSESETVAQLQQKIFESAQRSRAEYFGTAKAVTQFAMQARDAFANNDEAILFAEQLNKKFAIAGTNQEGIAAATLQLSQGMASGVLRGEELNSVFENAQPIIQSIADYMEVPIGRIREMASDGLITSEIIKNAMFASIDETNKKFESMPKTFSQIGVMIGNEAKKMFSPVLIEMNKIANTGQFTNMVNQIIAGLASIAWWTTQLFGVIVTIGGLFYENWSMIEPIMWGIIGVLGIYNACVVANNLANLISIGIHTAQAIAIANKTGLTVAEVAATNSLTVAQWALNASILACPVFWIIIGIIMVIALFYAAVAAVNKFKGTTLSATGIICGAIMVAVAFVGNIFIALVNGIMDLFVVLWNFIATFANFFANVFDDKIRAVHRLFFGLVDGVLSLLQTLANAIDAIFGSNLAGAVQGWRNNLGSWVDKTYGKGKEVMAKMSAESVHLQRIDYGDSWKSGYNFGKGVDDKISNIFSPSKMNIQDMQGYDPNALANNVADTAGNTAAMKDSLAATDEDLKYIKDLAEQEVVNRFTTAEIKVDMSNYNQINSDLDLDGIVRHLEKGVEEALIVAAEGVHV